MEDAWKMRGGYCSMPFAGSFHAFSVQPPWDSYNIHWTSIQLPHMPFPRFAQCIAMAASARWGHFPVLRTGAPPPPPSPPLRPPQVCSLPNEELLQHEIRLQHFLGRTLFRTAPAPLRTLGAGIPMRFQDEAQTEPLTDRVPTDPDTLQMAAILNLTPGLADALGHAMGAADVPAGAGPLRFVTGDVGCSLPRGRGGGGHAGMYWNGHTPQEEGGYARESLEGGGGTPPSPPPHCTDSPPKALPYPNTRPQPHSQPPVTAFPPTALPSPVTALPPLWNCPVRPSPLSKALGYPPPWTPPPLLPFQCLRPTAKILLRRLRPQEDLSFKSFGLPSAGTIGGPREEDAPGQSPLTPPLQTPPPPVGVDRHRFRCCVRCSSAPSVSHLALKMRGREKLPTHVYSRDCAALRVQRLGLLAEVD